MDESNLCNLERGVNIKGKSNISAFTLQSGLLLTYSGVVQIFCCQQTLLMIQRESITYKASVVLVLYSYNYYSIIAEECTSTVNINVRV